MNKFEKWLDELVKLKGGIYPVKINNFVKEIDKNHTFIRDKLGGKQKTIQLDVNCAELQQDISRNITDLALNLYYAIPNYFSEYKLVYYNDFGLPYYPQFKGIKIGKHVQTWMEKQKTAKKTTENVQKLLSQLGEVWSQLKISKEKIWANISTDPRAFCLLGNYGCDKNSCFAQGAMNQDKRYTFAVQPDTFVLTAKSDKKFSYSLDDNCLLRAIGFIKDDVINFHGTFGQAVGKATVLNEVVEKIAEDYFQTDKLKVETNNTTIAGGGMYTHTPTWAFGLKKPTTEQCFLKAEKAYPTSQQKVL